MKPQSKLCHRPLLLLLCSVHSNVSAATFSLSGVHAAFNNTRETGIISTRSAVPPHTTNVCPIYVDAAFYSNDQLYVNAIWCGWRREGLGLALASDLHRL